MGIKILVVDDAGFVRDTIKRTLRKMLPNGEIHEAIDGKKAQAVLRKHKIDLILSDWEMPEVTGHELLQWVREQEALEKTPFIMITSRGDKENVVEAVKAGVNDYISKPFTPDELQRKVTKQLRRLGVKSQSMPSSQGDSASLLTGGAKKAHIQKPRVIQEATGFGKPVSAKPAVSKSNFKGKAYLRFAGIETPYECAVKDLTLQALSGIVVRNNQLPTVFDQAAVDLENEQGEVVARLNGYVHAILATSAHPEAKTLKINIRFVDDDPQKLEVLSLLIAGG